MTSIIRQTNGRHKLAFFTGDRKRRWIYLGHTTRRQADLVASRIDDLLAAQLLGQSASIETARWVVGLPDRLHTALARAGLVRPRVTRTEALGQFVDEYIARKTAAKTNTTNGYRRTRKHLLAFFGAGKLLRDVTPGDAKDFRQFLLTDQRNDLGRVTRRAHAENTVRKTCAVSKQFFADAVDRGLIDRNPFKHRDVPTATNASGKARQRFITRDVAAAVLDACRHPEWRLLFALSRYGGLRCPSEHLGLRWGDVDWLRGRFTVTSPKTEHHPGGESRVVPLFPELRPYLEAVRPEAPEPGEWIIKRYRQPNCNLRTQLIRIIRRAGLEPWPKLFNNLRSSRQTELEELFPGHVVCQWMGNSETVARKHYLQVLDEHWDRATGAHNAPHSGQFLTIRRTSGHSTKRKEPAVKRLIPGKMNKRSRFLARTEQTKKGRRKKR